MDPNRPVIRPIAGPDCFVVLYMPPATGDDGVPPSTSLLWMDFAVWPAFEPNALYPAD